MITLDDCRAMDAADALAPLSHLFALPQGVVYLDGNSLGALPRSTAARVADVVTRQWGDGLIGSWNTAGWIDLPQRVGDKIARLVGAGSGEVVATDSTSVNLYKVLSAALDLAARQYPGRKVILSERSNFPTDLYTAQSLCSARGLELKLVDAAEILAALDTSVAVLMLTHVNYRTGAMHDMKATTAAAHSAGVITVWDLAHSAGAVPLDLRAADADFAIGCGYKFFNGGPGAPAFVWVNSRLVNDTTQPLAGWWGHASPFEFSTGFRPSPGITRYLCGTQPMLALAALDCGVDTLLAAEPFGGMAAIRSKSLALTDLFMALVEARCSGHGLGLVTPRDHTSRGSQVSFSRAEGAYAIVQALIARGVIGDFRAGEAGQGGTAASEDILRFGFTPLYLRFEDVWNAVDHLRDVLQSGEWQRSEFKRKQAVT
ncbi:MAG: kynureninase [Pseudomonadota bacterium]